MKIPLLFLVLTGWLLFPLPASRAQVRLTELLVVNTIGLQDRAVTPQAVD